VERWKALALQRANQGKALAGGQLKARYDLVGFGGVISLHSAFDKQVKHLRVLFERTPQKIFLLPPLSAFLTKKGSQHFRGLSKF